MGVREECAHALAAVRVGGPTVMNALKEAADNDDPALSQAAKLALEDLKAASGGDN